MTEEPKKHEGGWARLASELVAFIPKNMREIIGVHVGIYLFILTPIVLLFGVFALIKLFQEPKVPEVPCWQIQKVENRVFKLNSCTGETVELPQAPDSNEVGKKK